MNLKQPNCDRNTHKQNIIRKLILNSLDSRQQSKSESIAIRASKPQAYDKAPFLNLLNLVSLNQSSICLAPFICWSNSKKLDLATIPSSPQFSYYCPKVDDVQSQSLYIINFKS
jgi:hypothetical protein